MQGWIEQSDQFGEVLVRQGRGLVTAVVPVVDGSPDGFTRVEIDCERPAGRPRAMRYRVHPVIAGDDPLVGEARRAQAEGHLVEWTVRWVRHGWIPADLPITALNLASDATAMLAGLTVSAPVRTALDAEWAALLSEGRAESFDGPADPS